MVGERWWVKGTDERWWAAGTRVYYVKFLVLIIIPVRIVRPRHGDRAKGVAQPKLGLADDRGEDVGRWHEGGRVEATALNHEPRDHAMELCVYKISLFIKK